MMPERDKLDRLTGYSYNQSVFIQEREESVKRILVTSALPYANGPLHIGHIAGAYLPADIYTRYKRLKGEEVIHICGTDEHGVPITIAAEERGISPQELVDHYYENIKNSFESLGILFDNFSRTSRSIHHQNAKKFFLKLYEKGYIYKRETEQFYCTKCKRFLPDRYIEGECPYCGYEKARGDQCENCGRWLEPVDLISPRCSICGTTPELRKTFHYYFKLSQLEEALEKWLRDKKHWKDNVRNTALSWIKEGLMDRAISRDLEWGVEVPLEDAKGKVLYVWFDAPIGYISSTIEWAEGIGEPDKWKLFWSDPGSRIIHFIGKDNIVFHAIVWPAMLIAHGEFLLPSDIPANEFLNLMGDKLSTSRKWALWIPELLEKYPPDYIRFGIASILPETKDSDFNFYEFRQRINSELADNFGNFVNRTLGFIKNYLGNHIPEPGTFDDMDRKFIESIESAPHRIGKHLEQFQFRKALREILDISQEGNRYFDYRRPWDTRKRDERRTATTLYLCASLVGSLSVLIEPYLPFSSRKIKEMLNLPYLPDWDGAGSLFLKAGRELGPIEILYRKIEKEKIEAEISEFFARAGRGKERVSFETFEKLDIRIGEIIEAERIAGTEKLLKLKLNIGEEEITVVAGIAKDYKPEEIIGIKVPVVVNLEPVKIRGVMSEGMILAATQGERVVLISPIEEIEPGTSVK
jgi:methionyl-tRNA synthetase